jgi:hypothetical protein
LARNHRPDSEWYVSCGRRFGRPFDRALGLTYVLLRLTEDEYDTLRELAAATGVDATEAAMKILRAGLAKVPRRRPRSGGGR